VRGGVLGGKASITSQDLVARKYPWPMPDFFVTKAVGPVFGGVTYLQVQSRYEHPRTDEDLLQGPRREATT
jgi:hypothetical protein